jgi:hypothetical protein
VKIYKAIKDQTHLTKIPTFQDHINVNKRLENEAEGGEPKEWSSPTSLDPLISLGVCFTPYHPIIVMHALDYTYLKIHEHHIQVTILDMK